MSDSLTATFDGFHVASLRTPLEHCTGDPGIVERRDGTDPGCDAKFIGRRHGWPQFFQTLEAFAGLGDHVIDDHTGWYLDGMT
ncbi:MAG: hypothetical protein R3A46_01480 [Thermomicrobiales bacterium]